MTKMTKKMTKKGEEIKKKEWVKGEEEPTKKKRFRKYQIYFISCGENISIFTRAKHSWKILIFSPHSMKYIWYSP